jgi:hypothetical protein
MLFPEHSLPDVLERLHHNQPALEAALMELTLLVESQGHAAAGDNVRGALHALFGAKDAPDTARQIQTPKL